MDQNETRIDSNHDCAASSGVSGHPKIKKRPPV